jgi:hypothetical protein
MDIFRLFARDGASKFLLLQIDCIAFECWKYGNGHNFVSILSRLWNLLALFSLQPGSLAGQGSREA